MSKTKMVDDRYALYHKLVAQVREVAQSNGGTFHTAPLIEYKCICRECQDMWIPPLSIAYVVFEPKVSTNVRTVILNSGCHPREINAPPHRAWHCASMAESGGHQSCNVRTHSTDCRPNV